MTMADKPKITQAQIESRASAQSLARGQRYYEDGAISHAVQRGDEIEARCRGSYSTPYRVWAKLDGSGIVTTSCTCQYDWGGDCKHIIAMLLTYLHDPDQFEHRSTLHDALAGRSKETLVEIIEVMVTRYPDLQDLVDRPTPNEVVEGVVELDTLSFRQDLRGAFTNFGYEYHDEYGATPERKVNEIAAVAKRFSERDDWRNASAVYRAILEEFAAMDQDYYYDEEGNLAYAINEVAARMDDCLKQPDIIDDDNERRAIFDALLGVFVWDVNFGGIDIGMDVPEIILRHIRREDIPAIRQRVEAALDRNRSNRYGGWSAGVLNAFLTDLDTLDEVDPEIILKRLRDQGMYPLLVKKLLEMGRLDEAIRVIRQEVDTAYQQVQTLNLLADHGYDTQAQEVAEAILAGKYDDRMAHWLLDRYRASDNKPGMLRWLTKEMRISPHVHAYVELKATAQALGQWEALRPQIIEDLRNQGNFAVLTRVYLKDEEWELAWKTLQKAQRERIPGFGRPLDLEVAEASRRAMPERAIPVFIKYARQSINHRGRDNYRAAASLLAGVLEMYDRLDEIEKWETLIADIRAEFKTLPALQDELNKAGL
jgi:uncharacterized Zn finger protein